MQNKEKFNMVSISEVANSGNKRLEIEIYLSNILREYFLIRLSHYDITRVCHLQSENGAHWDSIFRCKYAIFLVFTGLENF